MQSAYKLAPLTLGAVKDEPVQKLIDHLTTWDIPHYVEQTPAGNGYYTVWHNVSDGERITTAWFDLIEDFSPHELHVEPATEVKPRSIPNLVTSYNRTADFSHLFFTNGDEAYVVRDNPILPKWSFEYGDGSKPFHQSEFFKTQDQAERAAKEYGRGFQGSWDD